MISIGYRGKNAVILYHLKNGLFSGAGGTGVLFRNAENRAYLLIPLP